jgi:hypothetical protein
LENSNSSEEGVEIMNGSPRTTGRLQSHDTPLHAGLSVALSYERAARHLHSLRYGAEFVYRIGVGLRSTRSRSCVLFFGGWAMRGQLWVEVVGDLIIARVRGEPTDSLLTECQEKVLFLVKDARRGKVLYDTLEMEAPPVDVPLAQRQLDAQLGPVTLRRAVVVPNSKLAYLARLAFGEGEYRVFYNDFSAAITWLNEPDPIERSTAQ